MERSIRRIFQSALPRGERLASHLQTNKNDAFQSALPRGERRSMHTMQDYAKLISIRAPTRGATQIYLLCAAGKGFQSALPRGERLLCTLGCRKLQDFNPRSHEGSDRDGVGYLQAAEDISIRAPTRGATFAFVKGKYIILRFQSALPRGERQHQRYGAGSGDEISIRAPTRGATRLHSGHRIIPEFQSALPRGERLVKSYKTKVEVLFQSALPRGERRWESCKILMTL